MSDDSQRYLVISADGHDGPPVRSDRFADYVESEYRAEFDECVVAETKMMDTMFGVQDGDFSNPIAAFVSGLLTNFFGNDPAYVERAVDLYWDEEPPILDPVARVATVEAQGVVAEFMITGASQFAKAPGCDPGLRNAVHDAHLRWTADYVQAVPGRIAATVSPDYTDLDTAVAQIRWARDHGLFGGVVLPGAEPTPPLIDPHWEPLWAVCSELDLPLVIHAGARFGAAGNYSSDPWEAKTLGMMEDSFFTKRIFLHLLVGGVFKRYPNLHVGLIEQFVALIPGLLEECDQQWFSHIGAHTHQLITKPPSEYWYEHMFVGAPFLTEHEGHDLRKAIGIDNLCWGGDYPHPEGSWPHMKTAIRRAVGGMPEADIRKVLGLNAAKWWGFDLDFLRPIADRVGPTVEELSTPLPEAEIPPDPTSLAFVPYRLGATTAA